MLILHIVIALCSIAVSTSCVFWPSIIKFRLSNYVIAATLASGSALAISNHRQIMHVCLSGLIYSLAASVLTYTAHRRLETINNH